MRIWTTRNIEEFMIGWKKNIDFNYLCVYKLHQDKFITSLPLLLNLPILVSSLGTSRPSSQSRLWQPITELHTVQAESVCQSLSFTHLSLNPNQSPSLTVRAACHQSLNFTQHRLSVSQLMNFAKSRLSVASHWALYNASKHTTILYRSNCHPVLDL